MNILTDEEINDLTGAAFYYHAWEGTTAMSVALARAIEAAVIKRLAAGVSVEPDGWRTQEYIGAPSQQEPYYNSDTFTTAIAAARVQENERCQKRADEWQEGAYNATCSEAIRALLGKEAQS